MERAKTQILVCGDVEGRFDQLYARVEEIQKKQRFDVLFCIGKFMENAESLEAYTSGLREAPITTYCLLTPEDASYFPPEIGELGGELCPRIHALGAMGQKEIHGLSVAYYASTVAANDLDEPRKEALVQYLASFTKQSFKGVDLLLTNQWPKGTLTAIPDTNLPISGLSMLEYDGVGDESIANVVSACVPRYHFASYLKKNIYFERFPYKNVRKFTDARVSHVTRFLSMASAFNAQKRKFLYAFALFPLHQMPSTELYAVPTNATEYPYVDKLADERAQKKQKLTDHTPREDASFVGDASKAKPAYAQHNNQKRFVSSGARKNECWFYMVSSVFEMQTVVKVAKHFYVTLAKGGVGEDHLLLVPIQHMPNSISLSRAAFDELICWKRALGLFYEARNENVIFCEHNQPPTQTELQHLIYQVIGLPKEVRIKEYFEMVAGNEGLEWVTCKNVKDINVQPQLRQVVGGGTYVWVDIPSEATHLFGVIEKERFPFSFVRRAVTQAMGRPELEDWKRCVLPKHQEERNARELRAELEKFCGEELQ